MAKIVPNLKSWTWYQRTGKVALAETLYWIRPVLVTQPKDDQWQGALAPGLVRASPGSSITAAG